MRTIGASALPTLAAVVIAGVLSFSSPSAALSVSSACAALHATPVFAADHDVGEAGSVALLGAWRQACPASAVVSLGQQVYRQSAQDAPQLLDLWKVRDASDALVKSTQQQQYAFLAWEHIDDGRADDGSNSWAERIQSIFGTDSATDESAPHLVFQAQAESLQQDEEEESLTLAEIRKANTARLVLLKPTYAVIRVDSLAGLTRVSQSLPRDTRMSRLLPAVDDVTTTDKKVKLPTPRYIPPLHSLLYSEALSVKKLRHDARILTGEDTKGQRRPSVHKGDTVYWHSRHSATYGARAAASWIREHMQHDLKSIGGICEEWEYDPEFAPNVVCTIPPDMDKVKARKAALTEDADAATADGALLFTSHLDSRGTFGSTKAPGGNDDGSGTTMLLAIARHIGTHEITFGREVRLVAFSGEEQGLVGSQHYARHLHETKQPIYFQLQTDMIGYRKPGEPLQAAFPDKLSTREATDYVMDVARIYVPELQLGYTPACCSDHQSFWEVGITSTWVFERRGPIADDRYHDSGDVTDRPGYDFDQVRANTRLVLATLLNIGDAIEWPFATSGR